MTMLRFKYSVIALTAAAAIACVPVLPAAAGVHGYGHLHPWGLGRGLVGAVVGLATLPLTIVSAALAASEPEAPEQASPGYAAGGRGYAPPPAYYAAPPAYRAAPQSYYAPPRAYFPARGPAYYPASRGYYAPRADAARSYYAARPGNYGGANYGGRGVYRGGGYGYPHR
jgi:hypothetical protein